MAPLLPSSHLLIRVAYSDFWRVGRTARIRAVGDIATVEGPVDVHVPLDDAHVIAGLHEGDLLREHFGIVDPDALRPALDPMRPGVIGCQDVGPLIVASDQLTQVEGAELDA